MKNKYDVAVAYRIYPKTSQTPFIYANNKYKLAEVCLISFRNSLIGCKAKIWVILDGCPPSYKKMFLKYFNKKDLVFVEKQGIGNHATFNLQLQILKRQKDSDIVYFAEDDYVYRENEFVKMINCLKKSEKIDFISPYDHLDLYNHDFNKGSFRISSSDNHHWRESPSTCLTILTNKSSLLKAESQLKTYARGNTDLSMWAGITKHKAFAFFDFLKHFLILDLFYCKIFYDIWKYSLFFIIFKRKMNLVTPVPSVATHAEKYYLAPNINWLNIVKSIESKK